MCQVAKLAGTDSFSVFTQKLQAFTIVLFSYTKLHVVGFNKDTRYNMSSEWLNVLGKDARCGHLKLCRPDGLDYWHACIGKSTAHMVADGSYLVLGNG